MPSQQPQFRRAGPADAPLVRDLTRAAYAKWVPLIGREPLPMGADYDRAVVDHRIDLIVVDGEVAGLVEMAIRPADLLIENVAVAPDRQGRGFGRRLLAHAEEVARAASRPELRLYTNALFVANLDLYRRLGFATEREEAFRGGTVVHMLKIVDGGRRKPRLPAGRSA